MNTVLFEKAVQYTVYGVWQQSLGLYSHSGYKVIRWLQQMRSVGEGGLLLLGQDEGDWPLKVLSSQA
jgi:hypothetical protein